MTYGEQNGKNAGISMRTVSLDNLMENMIVNFVPDLMEEH